jgi:hypothetical protein
MASDNTLGEEVSVDERTYEHPDADASAPVEQPRRPTVDRSGSRAAIARRLARRVASGTDLATASLAVLERTYERPGAIVPLGKLADVAARTVTVEAGVEQLWSPARANMTQVGLLADDTGRVKLTVWVKARPNQRLREASRPDRLGRRRPEPGQTGGRWRGGFGGRWSGSSRLVATSRDAHHPTLRSVLAR